MAMLRAEGLCKSYGGHRVLQGVTLELHTGELLAVLGPNGSGKSTLLRLLLLLERPDAGRIFLGGQEVRAGQVPAQRRMAAVFQRPFLFAGSVRDNVAFGLVARGARSAARQEGVTRALAAVGLESRAEANVRTLSGGEAQRVALARALVLAPEVLALDEPSANLDVAVRRRFRQDLERTARAHARSVLVVTHDPAEAFSLADRIAVMESGRVVQVATPAELMLAPATPFVAEFAGAELLLDGRVTEVDAPLVRVSLTAESALWASTASESPLSPGARVHVAYRPEDVTLAPAADVADTSAVNRLCLRVVALAPAGALVRVRLRGELELVALLTRRSTEHLGLAPGMEVAVHLKATALRAYAAE